MICYGLTLKRLKAGRSLTEARAISLAKTQLKHFAIIMV